MEQDHQGKFLILDVNTGDYEIDAEDLAASKRPLARRPDAILFGVRIGHRAAYRLGLGSRFTAVFKAQVVIQILRDDKTLAQIAAEHSVHPNQLSQWKATVLGAMPALFEKDENAQAVEKAAQEKQVAELFEQIGRLTTQLAWTNTKKS